MTVAVHPETDIEQDKGGHDARQPFRQFTRGTAESNQRIGHVPGHTPGHQGQYPTQMNITRRPYCIGLTGKGEQGCHHQQGFQPFPEQDKETGRQGRRRTQPIAGQGLSRLRQSLLGSGHFFTDLTGITLAVDGFTYGHKLAFCTSHQSSIDRRQLLLNHFEAIQISGQGCGFGTSLVPRRISLVRRGKLVMAQGDKAVLVEQRRRLAAQITQRGIGFLALRLEHILRRLRHQGVQIQRRLHPRNVVERRTPLRSHRLSHRLAAHVKRQRPTIVVAKRVAVGRHTGPFHPLGDGGVQTQ